MKDKLVDKDVDMDLNWDNQEDMKKIVEGKEMVDHPKHYNMGNIEVIDAIEDWKLGFLDGSAVKYVARAKYKGDFKENIKKAIWCLERLLND